MTAFACMKTASARVMPLEIGTNSVVPPESAAAPKLALAEDAGLPECVGGSEEERQSGAGTSKRNCARCEWALVARPIAPHLIYEQQVRIFGARAEEDAQRGDKGPFAEVRERASDRRPARQLEQER